MGSIYLAKRQSLFGNGSSNVTSSNPPLSGSQMTNTSSGPNNSIWKYVAIVIVLVVLATVAFSRLMLVRRLRARTSQYPEQGQSGAAMSYSGSGSRNGVLPPYYDRDEYNRRREQNREVRQALRDAGLLLVDDAAPSEVDRAHAERLARRERREERRRRRREAEEGAGLPAYSKEKGEGEKVLETGSKAKDDSGESSGESDDEDADDGRTSRAHLLSTALPQPPPPARVTERRRE